MSPLALLQEGETAEIVDPDEKRHFAHSHAHHHYRHGKDCPKNKRLTHPIRHAGHACFSTQHQAHLQDMGLRPGKKVEMITNSGTGPLVLRVDECRIAMGRGAAMKIYVRRTDP